jgi:hypothetical protein
MRSLYAVSRDAFISAQSATGMASLSPQMGGQRSQRHGEHVAKGCRIPQLRQADMASQAIPFLYLSHWHNSSRCYLTPLSLLTAHLDASVPCVGAFRNKLTAHPRFLKSSEGSQLSSCSTASFTQRRAIALYIFVGVPMVRLTYGTLL